MTRDEQCADFLFDMSPPRATRVSYYDESVHSQHCCNIYWCGNYFESSTIQQQWPRLQRQ